MISPHPRPFSPNYLFSFNLNVRGGAHASPHPRPFSPNYLISFNRMYGVEKGAQIITCVQGNYFKRKHKIFSL
jgi:hypothetical protein